ncbi:MAG: hypothetical protein JST01_20505 [Cyanobacteria bacterium SZAS TMP-1]|nr:hypothetical protein [Cyanobacteria bacterium SZAS TMP-1]
MAHSFLKISLLAALCVGLTAQAAHSQSYNYRSGNARVVQGAGGLPNPSSSYITGGTLSRSAQAGAGLCTYGGLQSGSSTAGITPGVSGNSNLPVARMGSTVGMPGDYMRSDLNPNFSYQQQPRQNTQYRNQRYYYQQQQSNPNQVATYGQQYARNSSNPTGKQATQIPIMGAHNQSSGSGAAAGSNAGSTTSSYGSTGSAAAYKGY